MRLMRLVTNEGKDLSISPAHFVSVERGQEFSRVRAGQMEILVRESYEEVIVEWESALANRTAPVYEDNPDPDDY